MRRTGDGARLGATAPVSDRWPMPDAEFPVAGNEQIDNEIQVAAFDSNVADVQWSHSLFDQPWWLDAVAPGSWSEVVIREGGIVIGRMPFGHARRLGVTVLGHPPLTQTLGPWVRVPSDASYAHGLTAEMDVMERLITALPRFDIFHQQFSHFVVNALPFHWAGFSTSIRYTYRIEDLTDLDAVLAGFRPNVRRHLRKAAGRLEVRDDLGLDRFLEVHASTFKRRGMAVPYDDSVVRHIDAASASRGCRRILFAQDSSGHVHAAQYIVWDKRATYGLMGGVDPDFTSSGAASVLMWEAIRHASTVSRAFDFEGSMVKSIERFVRQFGARQTPYLRVAKANVLGRALLAARSMARR